MLPCQKHPSVPAQALFEDESKGNPLVSHGLVKVQPLPSQPTQVLFPGLSSQARTWNYKGHNLSRNSKIENVSQEPHV